MLRIFYVVGKEIKVNFGYIGPEQGTINNAPKAEIAPALIRLLLGLTEKAYFVGVSSRSR